MRAVSPLLKRVLYPALSRSGYLRRGVSRGLSVVTYHGVRPKGYIAPNSLLDANLVDDETLRRELRLLKARYDIIEPEQLQLSLRTGQPLPDRAVLVTCDDGLRNNLTDMLPVLTEERVRCLFFVTARSAEPGRHFLWYEELYLLLQKRPEVLSELAPPESRLGEQSFHQAWWKAVEYASALTAPCREEWLAGVRSACGGCTTQNEAESARFHLLNANELRTLAEHAAVGAHTCTHPVLSLCQSEEARREIQESKLKLTQVLGRAVWAFAFPFGNPPTFRERELRLATEAGFECAFVNVRGGFVDVKDRYQIGRTHVTAEMNLGEFEAHVSGFHNLLRHRLGVE